MVWIPPLNNIVLCLIGEESTPNKGAPRFGLLSRRKRSSPAGLESYQKVSRLFAATHANGEGAG